MRVSAIVVAAGVGSRMGPQRGDVDSIPKPLLLIHGRPILAHTLTVLQAVKMVSEIILVVADEQRGRFRDMLAEEGVSGKVLAVVPGGKRRQDSTAVGLAHVPDETDIVVVHDGVRPMVTEEQISRVIAAAESNGAATVGLKCVDTVKRIANGRVLHTLDRSNLWLAQTPQAFQKDILARALSQAATDGVNATDEANLVERLGEPVQVVDGAVENLKITTRSDLALAEFYLGRRG